MTSKEDDLFCTELKDLDPLLLSFTVLNTTDLGKIIKTTLASLSFIGYTLMFVFIYFTPKV